MLSFHRFLRSIFDCKVSYTDTTHGTAIGLPPQKDPPGTTPTDLHIRHIHGVFGLILVCRVFTGICQFRQEGRETWQSRSPSFVTLWCFLPQPQLHCDAHLFPHCGGG